MIERRRKAFDGYLRLGVQRANGKYDNREKYPDEPEELRSRGSRLHHLGGCKSRCIAGARQAIVKLYKFAGITMQEYLQSRAPPSTASFRKVTKDKDFYDLGP